MPKLAARSKTMPVIGNVNSTPTKKVEMQGVKGVQMAVMVGREDGAPNVALPVFNRRIEAGRPRPSRCAKRSFQNSPPGGRGSGWVWLLPGTGLILDSVVKQSPRGIFEEQHGRSTARGEWANAEYRSVGD